MITMQRCNVLNRALSGAKSCVNNRCSGAVSSASYSKLAVEKMSQKSEFLDFLKAPFAVMQHVWEQSLNMFK